ncbi:hypothetical protein NV379_01390 [Paenibacillus sp. N1-5-1-14]|uniref:hypothetical protein n=1 Tax=Paenibacillus radicibacter TaxID=2972488 RepID=UPI002159B1E0|nr:hypothetical protein [Paenibacillus radicibacter]MCR8641297.1 hypothetical protein [Paenibacillus radicibacter]
MPTPAQSKEKVEAVLPLPRKWSSIMVAAHIVLAFAVAFIAAWLLHPGYNLIAVLVIEAYVIAVIGLGKMNNIFGIFINERNLMSLSRLQVVVWTLLITSSFFTVFVERLASATADPLNIEVDPSLWTLMGISVSSALFGAMIQNTKKNRTVDIELKNTLIRKADAAYGQGEDQIAENLQGTLFANTSYTEARFTDIFEGEEIQNHAYIDIAKVQMFIFSAITFIAYFAAAFSLIHKAGVPTQLPILNDQFLALIGVSHGGYLIGKIPNYTKSTPE